MSTSGNLKTLIGELVPGDFLIDQDSDHPEHENETLLVISVDETKITLITREITYLTWQLAANEFLDIDRCGWKLIPICT